ncbi:MAG: MFS transporter [Burkholderiales bacterium]
MPITRTQSLRYGLSGLVVSATSLPLYILVPNVYANTYELSLATIGVILMLVRLLDAVTDPLVGKLIDKTPSRHKFQFWCLPSAALMAASYIALINPPSALSSNLQVLTYMGLFTLLVSASAGALSIAIQAWPIQWTNNTGEQSALVSRREQFTLLGVIIASTLSTMTHTNIFSIYLICITVMTSLCLLSLPRLHNSSLTYTAFDWQSFRLMTQLMTPLFISALANATAATLFMFYVTDYLGLSKAHGGGLLGIYFTSALLGIWFWQRTIATYNTISLYKIILCMTVIIFIPGFAINDTNPELFTLICIGTGFFVGAELLLTSMLLIKKIKFINQEKHSATIFGAWGLLMKLGLAIAAGLALPLLSFWGYQPGLTPKHESLAIIYLSIPIILKLISLSLLHLHNRRHGHIYATSND